MCPGAPQAALVRSEVLLRRRLQELSHDLSDASLQQVRGGGRGQQVCVDSEKLRCKLKETWVLTCVQHIADTVAAAFGAAWPKCTVFWVPAIPLHC
jgi:hypothetical protein